MALASYHDNHNFTIRNKKALVVFQANLGRSVQATKTLSNTQLEFDQDISLVQEPYNLKNKVIGFPIKTKIMQFHENRKVATIIHNDNVDIFPIKVKQKLIIAKITWNNIEITTVNCYIPPQAGTLPELLEIEQYLKSVNSAEKILIVGDFNSKNSIWGGDLTNNRGL